MKTQYLEEYLKTNDTTLNVIWVLEFHVFEVSVNNLEGFAEYGKTLKEALENLSIHIWNLEE